MMKHFLPTTIASLLLITSVAGCHKEQPQPVMPPMQAQAPALPDATSPTEPVKIISVEPKKTEPKTAVVTPPPTPPPPAPKPEKHKRTKTQTPPPQPAAPTATTTDSTPPATTPSATTPAPAPVTPAPAVAATGAPHPANGTATASPIGQLTEGDTSGTAQVQEETERLIQSIEKGLAGLQRPLDSQEQETAKQIKKFIDQAREALAAQDAGGAHTLAVKANLLLTELKK